MKKLLFLTFDMEEFDIPLDSSGTPSDESKMYEVTYYGMKNVIKLLDKTHAKSTFFTTTVFGKKYPNLIRKLLNSGHEIAFHGCQHSHEYHKMRIRDAYRLIKDGKRELEKITNKKIIGFRAPRLFPPSFKVLEKAGFEYDSSIHPTWVPGHYFNMGKTRSMYYDGNLRILPISVTPLFRMPFSWIWFRNFGLVYAKFCTMMCRLDQPYVNIYFHPWEFVDLSNLEFGSRLPIIIKKNTGEKMTKMLSEYIKWCHKNDFKITTIEKGLSELIFSH